MMNFLAAIGFNLAGAPEILLYCRESPRHDGCMTKGLSRKSPFAIVMAMTFA